MIFGIRAVGAESCDYSTLSASETTVLEGSEQQRNFSACRTGFGYCDTSRLTPSEAGALTAKQKPEVR
jgi:hypothetical protein